MTTLNKQKTVSARLKPAITSTNKSSNTKIIKKSSTSGRLVNRSDGTLKMAPVIIRGVRKLTNGYYVVQLTGNSEIKNFPEIPDATVARLLGRLSNNRDVFSTETIKNPANKIFLKNLNEQAITSRMKHFEDGSLVKSSELWSRLGISRQAGSKAINELRFFTLDGPGGLNFCPAFFADPQFDRAQLETVSKELGAIPGPRKWQFFTTPKLTLKGKTPLEAIKNGQLDEVLSAVVGFKER